MHFLAFVGMRCPPSVARWTAMARFSSPGIRFSAKEEASSLVAKVPTARMRGFRCHSGRPCQKSTITVSLANQKAASRPSGRPGGKGRRDEQADETVGRQRRGGRVGT